MLLRRIQIGVEAGMELVRVVEVVEVVEVTNSRGRVPATCPTGPVSGNQTSAELPTSDFLI